MKRIDQLIDLYNIKAAIFDLDGTLIDNNEYHLITWQKYLEQLGRNITKEEYNENINGRTNKNALEYVYGRKMTDEEVMPLALLKEEMYRELYQPHIIPVPGLVDLLEHLAEKMLPMAIATSGIEVNIEFMFNNIPIKHYFKTVINSSHIKHGKPDPEIYFRAAASLNIPANQCLVFEDAVVGIESAKAAGMKAIALTTTHSSEELYQADLLITNYTELL